MELKRFCLRWKIAGIASVSEKVCLGHKSKQEQVYVENIDYNHNNLMNTRPHDNGVGMAKLG